MEVGGGDHVKEGATSIFQVEVQRLDQLQQQQTQTQNQVLTRSQWWNRFEDATRCVLGEWTALHMACANNWGEGDSIQKKELFLQELLALIRNHNGRLYPDELEPFLDTYLEEQFWTICEDGSIEEVSKLLCQMHLECGTGNLSTANCIIENSVRNHQKRQRQQEEANARAREQYERNKAQYETGNVVGTNGGVSDMTMESSDATNGPPMEDEDGWTTVRKSRRGKNRNKNS